MVRFFAFFGVLAQAFACESAYVPPCEVGSRYDSIFLGTAIEAHSKYGPFRFRVEEAFKGIAAETKEVEVGSGPCEAGYQVGSRYLILTSHPKGAQAGFSLGERAEAAGESIALFRALSRGEHMIAIHGSVAENVEDSGVRYELDAEPHSRLLGVEITASKDGVNYSTRSDFSGSYSLRLPDAGSYRVVAKLAGHATARASYGLRLAPDTCQELNFGMWTASRIAGHVIGADGRPVEGFAVQLEPAADLRRPPDVKTDAAGMFEFTNIPEGEYLLGVNIGGINSKLPYAPRFYPGVPERSAARVVKITGAQQIEGLDFQIGPRKPTRRIEIGVEWSDGRPVINAGVFCSSSTSDTAGGRGDYMTRYVDLNGQATCTVLADQNFEVDVVSLSWNGLSRGVPRDPTRSQQAVPAGTEPVHLKFVIDLVNDISARAAPENRAAFNDMDF